MRYFKRLEDGSLATIGGRFGRSAHVPSVGKSYDEVFTDGFFVSGMLLITLQSTQIAMAQPGHLWMLAAAFFAIARGQAYITAREIFVLAIFICTTIVCTYFQDFGRVKAAEQIFKFGLIYPGFYFVGRWLGTIYSARQLPLGYKYLFGLLAVQFIVQLLAIPLLYHELNFAEGALHGTFKERNWLALYFLMFSYFIFLRSRSTPAFAIFIVLNGIVALLSGSKTAFIGCGIIFLIHGRTNIGLKAVALIIGAAFYWWIFANDLSADQLAVRTETERGLAFSYAIDLIRENPFGHGVGFVEWFFDQKAEVIMGLGAGTNSVFCTPLDLMIIAGGAGLLLWLFIFLGVGLGAFTILLPIAILSLLNPLHQSELVYFFIGMLVSASAFLKKQAAAV